MSDKVVLHISNSVSSHMAPALSTKSVPCPPLIRITLRLSPLRIQFTPAEDSVSPVYQMLQQELIHPKEFGQGAKLHCGSDFKEPNRQNAN